MLAACRRTTSHVTTEGDQAPAPRYPGHSPPADAKHMTTPLIGEPLVKMSYKRARQVKVLAGNEALLARFIKGVLISAENVQVLRALAARNIIVRLECPGQPTYQGRVQAIVKRLVPVPAAEFWYLPVTMTGPLRESGSAV